jgi:predicted acyl esterase
MTFASRFLEQTLKLPPAVSRDIDVQRGLRVRMPDGVVLLADRYAPRARPWPLRPPPPLVLVRSPYGRRRGAHPRYARNPGTGEPLGTAVRLVLARQQVFHDPGHPSALLLPVPL